MGKLLELYAICEQFITERLQFVNDEANVTEASRVTVPVVMFEIWVTLRAMIVGQFQHGTLNRVQVLESLI